ncbi:alpha/beta fold hydrolase [Dyadobacter frigoris]|uniref:Alpha/beta fold hydrolase n=1 Tax=Dyadobacter frigoris TaxID=2576211 RepID=A0A4U6D3K2_9BACT|nr:alpha/beta fold hydrolase [Dyadobacter frigoris]TKT91792.1 alpha/beta fold hydrolase [Dyadobacter frigoris]GLU55558.1 esterase [Dyadobacter frigoris]
MKSIKIKSVISHLFLSVLILSSVISNAQSTQKNPVYVLVHGAWHGGWCWQKVSKNLRANGAEVYTPTLSGLGEHRNTLNKDINLDTHIEDIVNLIVMEDLRNVILVGHSYAGTVIAGVADRIPERLNKLIFLDAMIVRNGESALSVHPKEAREYSENSSKSSNGLSIPSFPVEAFGITNKEDAKWINERLTPQPFKTFTQTLVLKNPYGNHLPLIYIACTNPQMPVLKTFSDRVKNDKNWKHYSLNTGHDAMITVPDELSALLEKISK